MRSSIWFSSKPIYTRIWFSCNERSGGKEPSSCCKSRIRSKTIPQVVYSFATRWKVTDVGGCQSAPPSEKMWAVVSSDKTVDRPATRGGQPCNSPPTPPEMFKNVVKTPISFFFVRYKSQSFCQGQPPKIWADYDPDRWLQVSRLSPQIYLRSEVHVCLEQLLRRAGSLQNVKRQCTTKQGGENLTRAFPAL